MTAPFAAALLAWFDQQAADLPWRENERAPDPYRVWLSEIMLQQTQVSTVIPYFNHFLAAFPDVHALAAAPLDDVLKRWEGLGYYSRARNLHQTARIVAGEHAGRFPVTAAELQTLPGIGRYTAGAIASICYGERVPVVDGNVIRVFARLLDLDDDVTQAATKSKLWHIAANWLPAQRPGAYNQALMELGQTICRPRAPRCDACPLRAHCAAYGAGTQAQRPVKRRKAPTPHYDVVAGIIYNEDGRLLIAQRPPDGLLGGLWEFPGGKQEADETLPQALRRELREELAIEVTVGELFVVVRHAFTHFRITLHAFECRYRSGPPQTIGAQAFAWVQLDELDRYTFGKADREIIAALKARPNLLL